MEEEGPSWWWLLLRGGSWWLQLWPTLVERERETVGEKMVAGADEDDGGFLLSVFSPQFFQSSAPLSRLFSRDSVVFFSFSPPLSTVLSPRYVILLCFSA